MCQVSESRSSYGTLVTEVMGPSGLVSQEPAGMLPFTVYKSESQSWVEPGSGDRVGSRHPMGPPQLMKRNGPRCSLSVNCVLDASSSLSLLDLVWWLQCTCTPPQWRPYQAFLGSIFLVGIHVLILLFSRWFLFFCFCFFLF